MNLKTLVYNALVGKILAFNNLDLERYVNRRPVPFTPYKYPQDRIISYIDIGPHVENVSITAYNKAGELVGVLHEDSEMIFLDTPLSPDEETEMLALEDKGSNCTEQENIRLQYFLDRHEIISLSHTTGLEGTPLLEMWQDKIYVKNHLTD